MGVDLTCDDPIADEHHCMCDLSGPFLIGMCVAILIRQEGRMHHAGCFYC